MTERQSPKSEIELVRRVQHDRLINDLKTRAADVQTAEFLWIRHFTEMERRYLGANFASARRKFDTLDMWKELRGGTDDTATVEIAYRKGEINAPWRELLLRELGQLLTADKVEEVASTSQLVVLDDPRTTYWQSKQIDLPWGKHNVLWEFWIELCKASKCGDRLDGFSLGDDGDSNRLKDRKNKLGNKKLEFPRDLFDMIVTCGLGSYRLSLPVQEIRIFEKCADDEYQEWQRGKGSVR